jgi:hypothetical protein
MYTLKIRCDGKSVKIWNLESIQTGPGSPFAVKPPPPALAICSFAAQLSPSLPAAHVLMRSTSQEQNQIHMATTHTAAQLSLEFTSNPICICICQSTSSTTDVYIPPAHNYGASPSSRLAASR